MLPLFCSLFLLGMFLLRIYTQCLSCFIFKSFTVLDPITCSINLNSFFVFFWPSLQSGPKVYVWLNNSYVCLLVTVQFNGVFILLYLLALKFLAEVSIFCPQGMLTFNHHLCIK